MISVSALIAAHRPGQALDQGFYVREDIFARDMELLLDRWTCVGHAREIPEPGDWLTAELGAESVIVVRGDDGVTRALANVCRHRGSRICNELTGSAAALTCPYHAWTYRLDGRLRAAREMPEGFDPSAYGLTALPIRIVGGLVFVSFGRAPPALDDAAPALEAMTTRYGWEAAKVAHRRSYAVAANWKLVMENYHECYHCAPAHPEFSVLHTLARPEGRRPPASEAMAPGVGEVEAWGPKPDGREVARVMRSALAAGVLTGSEGGQPVAPLMGGAEDHDGGCVFAEVGFLSAFLAYPDHGVIYRFIPKSVLSTQMEVIWLVDGAAREGVDYDLGRLAWLWDVTSLADKTIIERNQKGVLSRFYRPGPYSKMEPGTRLYVERYLAELARAGDGHGL
ncbi:MAG: aromatic ring-hydroxylating dioxygenase subunit alpha [Caulobacteraceae bacterium]|nr:aromatic ring-hydroxylating dioxygenase subunit alpha [Caulobacteraceae bacterium]